MNVSLRIELKSLVDERVGGCCCGSITEYVRDLVLISDCHSEGAAT
jgi:hypothetical protein